MELNQNLKKNCKGVQAVNHILDKNFVFKAVKSLPRSATQNSIGWS
jgi:hypothetical protein